MILFRRSLTVVLASIILCTSLLYLQIGYSQEMNNHLNLPVDELRTFSEIFGSIKNSYVKNIQDRELLQNAMKGMLSSLDPHSTYLILKTSKPCVRVLQVDLVD